MKNRMLLLGLSLLSMAVLIAVGIGWLRGYEPVSGRQGDVAVAALPTPLNRLPSALAAYEALKPWASEWAADYRLVSANLTIDVVAQQSPGWSFILYSAKRERLVSVLVSPSEIRVLREQGVLYPPRLIGDEAWKEDASAVLLSWWQARGGHQWTAMEATKVILTLRQEKSGYPVWKLICLGTEGTVLDSWYLRADNGAIIDAPEAP